MQSRRVKEGIAHRVTVGTSRSERKTRRKNTKSTESTKRTESTRINRIKRVRKSTGREVSATERNTNRTESIRINGTRRATKSIGREVNETERNTTRNQKSDITERTKSGRISTESGRNRLEIGEKIDTEISRRITDQTGRSGHRITGGRIAEKDLAAGLVDTIEVNRLSAIGDGENLGPVSGRANKRRGRSETKTAATTTTGGITSDSRNRYQLVRAAD
jgi:hypothetical protein